ncbi:MAG TPA: ribosomal L7Ae/L30e/S12e/Gadd45 family protein [Nitrososphaera sp.]|jgi:large subunit ribosomal protein L30e
MKALEKVIKEAIASDKYKSGVREVLHSVKGSKLIIVSKSIDSADRAKLEEQAKTTNVPVYEYPGTSVQLGKLCNRPYRITAIAIKSGTAAEIDAIMSEGATAASK